MTAAFSLKHFSDCGLEIDVSRKGYDLEELVRTYFELQGFFALRGISYTYDNEQITDIDVWLYGRQSRATIRTRAIVDVKNKRSPKALERILWVRGMQMALGCDRAIVVTTDRSKKVTGFAHQQNVALLKSDFLSRRQAGMPRRERLTYEEFVANIRCYRDHKQDGDWLKRISNAKSALVSLKGYRAFNAAISEFGFFAERAETRPRYTEQAVRCAYLTAAIACVALDSALERVAYEELSSRQRAIVDGVTYGAESVTENVSRVLDVIAQGVENGRVISKQVRDALDAMFKNVRADIVAEYFKREHHAGALVEVARELDDRAHRAQAVDIKRISTEAKGTLGVFADFVRAKRSALMGDTTSGVQGRREERGDTASTEAGGSSGCRDREQSDLFGGGRGEDDRVVGEG